MPTWATGTSPSNGQPNEVAIAPSTGIPASCAIRTTSSKPLSDPSTERLTFFRLWLSDAETNTRISSTPASAARSAPLAFGTSAANLVPLERSTPWSTSAASASCGTARGETKDEYSMIGTPAPTSSLISSILVAVGMKSRSICQPSRGPTSVTVTFLGPGMSCLPMKVLGVPTLSSAPTAQ